jgi:hypothetical protein
MFDGPRRYLEQARYELDNPSLIPSDNVWVKKIKQLFIQRDSYQDQAKYAYEQPIYHSLLSILENSHVSSPKHIIEAFLLTELTFQQIAERLMPMNKQYNPFFIALYHDLFYNIRSYENDELAMYRFVIQPMLSFNSYNIAIDHIWKLLAYRGGSKLLTDVGLGNKPFSADDVDYLLHLTSMRSASMILKYASSGIDSFGEDAALASNVLGVIYKYEANRSLDRDDQGFRAITDTSASEYSSALTDVFKKVVHIEPTEDKLLADGKFDVNNMEAIEECSISE